MRAQANLPALAVALVILTAVAGMSLGMADRAYLSADRDPGERRVAVALSERLVSSEAEVTSRANVLNASAIGRLDGSRLQSLFPVVDGRAFRIRLDDRVLAEAGDPTGGATIRRIVLVERRRSVTVTPPLTGAEPTVTLPRRSPKAALVVDPRNGVTVTTVRANGRVVLRNSSGLAGRFTVDLSRFETTTFSFEADGDLSTGAVAVTYYPATTTKAVLEVTVDG